MRKKRESKPEPPPRIGLYLALSTLLVLLASLVFGYLFGLRWASWAGTAGMLLMVVWLGLTPLAAVMLVLDVVHTKRRTAPLILRTVVLLMLLIATPLQLPMEGPELQDIAFQHGFQRRVESMVTPQELQTTAAELLLQHRDANEQVASFRDETGLKALPEPIRRLQPESVVVDVPKELVSLSWPTRFGWALDVSRQGLRYYGSAD